MDHNQRQDHTAVIILRVIGLIVMLAGMALAIIPFFAGHHSTITVFAFLLSGVGLIAAGFGVLQLHIWGFYLLLAADIIAIIALFVNYRTLPLFKSFFIVLGLLVLGYMILQRDQFRSKQHPL